ncbi:hypothetical protein MMC18_003169 [Xylographa bjoerkii]|nr:hypothetical protein [Xylographa bjoerkii]
MITITSSVALAKPIRWIETCLRQCLRRRHSTSPTDQPAPPLLLKFKSDVKVAMKAKDTNRLNVLRGILAETINASKTSTPFKTDIQLLSLLKKHAAASKSAAQEFGVARRDDLKIKEEAQIAVLEEYASQVKIVGKDEVTEAIAKVIEEMRAEGVAINTGSVLKAVVGAGGALDGKPIEKAEVAGFVKGMLLRK